MKMPDVLVEITDLQLFVVHSNEMACRKRGRIGLDPVYCIIDIQLNVPPTNYNTN